jgi:hypothetical protein
MIILPIQEAAQIDDLSTKEGQVWSQILDILESWAGFRRLYWGRHVEEGLVHLHIGRNTTKITEQATKKPR